MLLDNRPSLKRSAPCSFSDKRYESSNLDDQSKQVTIHQEIMETFEKQTQLVPNPNTLPTTRFNNKRPILNYLPKTSTTPTQNDDIYLMWTLTQALLDNKLREWLLQLVEPGLEDALYRIQKQTNHDPWADIFTFLCFGQSKRASQKAKEIRFFELAMLIDLSTVKSMQSVIEKQITGLQTTGRWVEMTPYQKKVWYLLSGRLGHVPENYVVTEGQTWECTLSMYIWYSQAVNDESVINLSPFINMFKRPNKKRNVEQALTAHMIAAPDETCLWYQLLSWWYGGEDDDYTHNYLQGWPLEFTWLLSFYRPDRFKNDDDSLGLAWIERLQKLGLPEWAIYASLFLQDVDKHVDHLLQVCEWEKEDVLLNSFHIPKDRILYAKALHAHDEWDFEAEYTLFLQASRLTEAKAALFDFLLPKLYKVDDTSCLTSSLDYINQYSSQEDEEIKMFKDVYSALLTKESDNVETIISAFENVDMSPKRSYNFFKLVSKLNDALTDLTRL